MDGGVVAVAGFTVGGAGCEVDGAGDFFVEERVLHGFGAVGVDADGEFADVTGAFVGVEDFVEMVGVVGGCVDDFAVFEGEADVGVGCAAVEGRAVVVDGSVDGFADGRGEDFAVGYVAETAAGAGGDVFDGENEVGSLRAFDANAVGLLHEGFEGLHGS